MTNGSVLSFSRRRQLIFYRRLAGVSIFLLVSILFLNNSQEQLCTTKRYNGISYKVQRDRRKAELENWDEFLEEVFNDTSYLEVDLFARSGPVLSYQIYDKSIRDMETGVVVGMGGNGDNSTVPPGLKGEAEKVYLKEAFNRILSEMISVNRSVPETRETPCRSMKYDVSTLPTLSVIIIYSNEAFISIIRTVHSVINRTPQNILQEVILVDDFSDNLDLQGKLERYLATRINPLGKVRLLKLSRRTGLIRARMIGAHVAVGDVLMFLDAHCEVNTKWAEPLLQRIQESRTTVVSPVIDNIDQNTLEYSKDDSGYFFVGGFSWTGYFQWKKIPSYEKRRKQFHHSPTRTAMIAGGLFAVDRKYFWEIGSYDPKMEIWGGENLEISLRVWQCGGSMEIIPCSRVGHIFRNFRPYDFPKGGGNGEVNWNTARVAEVWMDEYKELYYLHNPEMKWQGFGDVSRRKAWRKRRGCKSFDWYLKHVYREKFRSAWDSKLYGQVRNPKSDLCLDSMQHDEQSTYTLELYPCHGQLHNSQLFFLSKKDELRRESGCATVAYFEEEKGNFDETGMVIVKDNRVTMKECVEGEEEGGENVVVNSWEYRKDQNGRIIHAATEKCLTVREEGNRTLAVLEKCLPFGENDFGDEGNVGESGNQKWEWATFK